MNKVIFKAIATNIALVLVLMFSLSSTVYADRDKRDWRKLPKKPAPDYRLDKRFDHNRSYPRDGVRINRLPDRRYPIKYRNKSYFYIGGTWYLPLGPSYVVVRPPIGIVVPVLPSFYTTIWFGGIPYYYANDIYYVWRPDLNGYQVIEPPLKENEPAPPVIADELFIYPKEGQDEKQQADDRYACHRWGVEQSSYDPTQPPGNIPVNELSQLRKDYNRAMKACLEGRGYSVR